MARRGFSLIELLVAMAVLALLAAILFPAFATARGKAYQAACSSNLQQLGKAWTMYVEDSDERLPVLLGSPFPWPSYGGAPAPYWYDVLQPYLRSADVLRCRCDDRLPHRVLSPAAPPYACSYSPNVYLDRTCEAVIAEPAATVLLVDGALNYAMRRNDGSSGITLPHYHSQGWNVLFCDGHAKWRQSELPDAGYHWANGFPTPNANGF